MQDESAALREALEAVPTSIRRLAEEAGVDEKLLRMIRDGDRRLTPSVRNTLLGALRRWEERVGGAIEALEAVIPQGEGGDDGQ